MKQPIRWGILGTAEIARSAVVPAIQKSRNGKVIAVASRDLAKAKAFANPLGIERAYGSYEELLADPNVDAIYNPLPVSLHAPWSIRAAEAGKPTLCEKPLATNAREAQAMIAAFSKRQLLLAEALMYRYHPLTQRAVQMVKDGGVGDIQLLRASFTAQPARGATDFRFRRELGGGVMLDLGVYCVSILRWLAGEEPSACNAIVQTGTTSGVDERAAGALRFPSGKIGSFSCGMPLQFECSYSVIGTNGHLLVDWGAMVAWPGSEFKIRHWQGNNYQEIAISPANHYQLMVEDFGDSLLTGQPMRFPIEDSARNLQIIDRIRTVAG